MSRNAQIELDWADGTYTFRLAWKQIEELQEKCDAGPFLILHRLESRLCRVEEISNVIRLGLIGGGLSPSDALKLVRRYVEDRPPAENVLVAQAIMAAGCVGAPDEEVGKKAEAASQEGEASRSPTEKSDLPPSTGTGPG